MEEAGLIMSDKKNFVLLKDGVQLQSAKDWGGPPKLQNGTSFFYFTTDQWRFEETAINDLVSPTVGKARYDHPADYNVLAARLGWLPSYPTFNQNGIELYKEAVARGYETTEEIGNYIAKQLKEKELQFAIEDPDNPVNFPETLIRMASKFNFKFW